MNLTPTAAQALLTRPAAKAHSTLPSGAAKPTGEQRADRSVRTKVAARAANDAAAPRRTEALAQARTENRAQRRKLANQAARIEALEQTLVELRQQIPAKVVPKQRFSVRDFSRRWARALKREIFYFTLEPMHGIERVGADRHTFCAKTNPAQFAMRNPDTRLPYGWVKISTRFVTKYAANTHLRLYVDTGAGFCAADSHALPAPNSADSSIETFHFIAPSLHEFRLDVIVNKLDASFELDTIKMQELTKQEALAGLLLQAARQRRIPLNRWPQAAAKLARHLKGGGISGCLSLLHSRIAQPTMGYTHWVERYDTLNEFDRAAIKMHQAQLVRRPKFSIIMPVYNTPADYLSCAIKSVQAQLYDNWELCIADDASDEPHIASIIGEAMRQDKRIKTIFRKQTGHICAASNDALALATGQFVVFLDHDDELREHALYLLAETVDAYPEAKLIYSDEDKITTEGHRFDPYFKPDWNPDLLRSQNYINHLACFRLDNVRSAGNLRLGLEGSQDYDLVLRVTQHLSPDEIHHIPHVLYLWRSVAGSTANEPHAKPYTFKAATRALEDDLERRNERASVSLRPDGYFRIRFALPDIPPQVSIIIPTRDQLKLLRQCVQSIQEKTSYKNYEIIIVDNDSAEPATHRYLKSLQSDARVRVVPYHKVFNYAAINNTAVALAKGEVVCLLNNDIEVINVDWLDELVSHALRPEIGAVGAKLYYADKSLQHAGVVLGVGGIAGHALKHLPGNTDQAFSRANLVQNYAAVTGACLAIRRETYQKVGGLNEALRVAFNDVDFCLKVRALGLRNLYTPYAELVHHESATRGTDFTPVKLARANQESALMQARWGSLLTQDPNYNPNLSLKIEDFSLAWPPRAKKPWLSGDAHVLAE